MGRLDMGRAFRGKIKNYARKVYMHAFALYILLAGMIGAQWLANLRGAII